MIFLRKFRLFLLIASLPLAMQSAVADTDSVTGDWQTIDHATHQPSSIVHIEKVDGKYVGNVTKIFEENGHKVDDLCINCKGEQHNQPILGMKIIYDFEQRNGALKGMILDPESGKLYRCQMKLIENGQRLKVRGYVGTPLLGRTDIWQRLQP